MAQMMMSPAAVKQMMARSSKKPMMNARDQAAMKKKSRQAKRYPHPDSKGGK